jgi:14-3-3 protein epsilon
MSIFNVPLEPSPDSLSAEQALGMAKLAESAERYKEMTEYMNRCVRDKKGDELTVEERNLISVGYKNLMSSRRTAQRVTQQQMDTTGLLAQILDVQPGDPLESDFTKVAETYKSSIAEELKELINEVVEKVVGKFVKGPEKATETEVLVFFHKMEGDYNRYGAEVTSGEEKAAFTTKAEKAYSEATTLCETKKAGTDEDELPATNPIRLGLALNYSVFMYEILEKKEEASKVADSAFEAAIDKLDELSEEQYRDSTLIMQLLKDNRDLWNSDPDLMP